jgi:large subunit ribosomal protein L13
MCRKEDQDRQWVIVDASQQILGRLSTKIAHKLRGKDKVDFTPHVDNGDFVIVINAEKIQVTGRKMNDKKYYRHSGYPGGLRETQLKTMLKNSPEHVIYEAVKGMLPKTRLGRAQLKKLKIYAGPEHPHSAQQPKPFEL